jgi:hypothetical protein
MARVKSGAAGEFNGGFKDAVLAKWKGLLISKAFPSPSSKPAVLSQLMQRAVFGLMTSFVSKVGETIELGFQNTKGALTAYNAAVKKNIFIAISGVYPNYTLDYAKFQFSDGNGEQIDGPEGIAHTAVVNKRTTITWTEEELLRPGSLGTDVLRVIFYNETGKFCMTHAEAAQRSKLTATVRLPFEDAADVVHGWVMFVSADGKMVSRSVYLGKILNTGA